MRSPGFLTSFAIALVVLSGRVVEGQTARRLRNLVEVSDLAKEEDATSGRKARQSSRQLEEEMALAQAEIYRLLAMDVAEYSFSMSMSMVPPPKTSAPSATPATKLPVPLPQPVAQPSTFEPTEPPPTFSPVAMLTLAPIQVPVSGSVSSEPQTFEPTQAPVSSNVPMEPSTSVPVSSPAPIEPAT